MRKRIIDGMESPISGGRVSLVEDLETHEFRKERYDVHVRYYVCEDTGERFTDKKQDELFCNELFNQYRIKHGLPFPDEIKSVRERYGLNFAQITKLAGFGRNQWRNYENGCVPSESNGRTIVALKNKASAQELLESCKGEFPQNEYERIKSQIATSSNDSDADIRLTLFYGRQKRDYFNGYSALMPSKLEDMVCFFVSKGVRYKTKLNKCLFYADMTNYAESGSSISGARYRAIQHGPVPEHYDTIYDNISSVFKTIDVVNDKEFETLHTTADAFNHLAGGELDTLEMVLEKFDGLTAREVVDLSHQEEVWQRHQAAHELIPYSEAFDLQLFKR